MFEGNKRSCCESYDNSWHARPCTVNGPTGQSAIVLNPREAAWAMDYGLPSGAVIVSEDIPKGIGIAGEFHVDVNHSPGELVGCAMENIDAGEHGTIRMGVGDELHPVTSKEGYYLARGIRLTPNRTCCSTYPGSPHWQGCGTYFFAEGQTIIKPDFNPMDPWGRARLRLKEDTVSSDRTFENETRPL